MPVIGNVAQMNEFSALLELGLSRVFKDDLPTHPKLYTAWLTERKAKEWIEDELLTTGFGPMPEKPVGNPITVDKPYISNPKDYEMTPYGLGFVAEYELIRWDKYGVFTDITKKLARSGVDRKNVLAYAILNNAFSTTDSTYTTYAGEALAETTHTLLRGGTAKNAPTVSVGLSYLGLQEAITDYMLLPNEDGLFILLNPSKVIAHPSKAWIGKTLLQTEGRPGTADNDINTLKGEGLSMHTSPYLTDTDAWFVVADKRQLAESMRFDVGDDLMFRQDYQISTWNRVYSMYASFRVAVFHWYGIWGSQG